MIVDDEHPSFFFWKNMWGGRFGWSWLHDQIRSFSQVIESLGLQYSHQTFGRGHPEKAPFRTLKRSAFNSSHATSVSLLSLSRGEREREKRKLTVVGFGAESCFYGFGRSQVSWFYDDLFSWDVQPRFKMNYFINSTLKRHAKFVHHITSTLSSCRYY